MRSLRIAIIAAMTAMLSVVCYAASPAPAIESQLIVAAVKASVPQPNFESIHLATAAANHATASASEERLRPNADGLVGDPDYNRTASARGLDPDAVSALRDPGEDGDAEGGDSSDGMRLAMVDPEDGDAGDEDGRTPLAA